MKTVIITVEKDSSCDMARVFDSEGNGMEGNFWDFHNGCHGMYDLPNFRSYHSLVNILKNMHEKNGKTVEIIRKDYKYT